MQVFIMLALVVALLVTVFTLQNIAPVTVVFLLWTFHGSLALVLFLALTAGVMICVFASLPALIKGKWTIASQNKKLLQLEESLEECKFKLHKAQRLTSAEVSSKPSDAQP